MILDLQIICHWFWVSCLSGQTRASKSCPYRVSVERNRGTSVSGNSGQDQNRQRNSALGHDNQSSICLQMKFKLVKSFLVAGCFRSGRPYCIEPWLAPLFRVGATCRRFQSSQQSSQKRSEPLRILFCGSDEFSSANLRALHEEQLRNPGLIESIDVVIRPGKRVGRGNKKIQHREHPS